MTSPSEELKRERERLFERFSSGKVQDTFQEDLSEITDQYFRSALQESEAGRRLFANKRPFALVALGGYGRKELCCHSDIDIMVLFKGAVPPSASDLIEGLFYPLWDLGLELGYAVRSIRDCMALAREDFLVFTSLLDARFIYGDSPLFLEFLNRFEGKVLKKKASAFQKWLRESSKARKVEFGDASYLLEPNLKEGIGGLREYHQIIWLARIFYNARVPGDLEVSGALHPAEYESLCKNLWIIWSTRCHLHLLSGRKNDRLFFEHQHNIARLLGFRDKPHLPAVEQFLGDLHASMAAVKSLKSSFMLSHVPKRRRPGATGTEKPVPVAPGLILQHDEIGFDHEAGIRSRPVLLMEIFKKSAKQGYPLSPEAGRLIKEFSYLVDDNFRESPEVVKMFLSILHHRRAFDILDQMLETGLLEAFIPEFREIRNRIQFDAYHIFPAGKHALQTVRYLKSLSGEKDLLLLDIMADLPHTDNLFLAALFHDIGKMSKDHARRGAAITARILKRFHYDPRFQKEVVFLVRHHLLLAKTATRRDLNDEKAVIQCARTIGSINRLKMLYLLTWADSRATGPKAWNEWIANLVRELFFKVLHILEKKDLATPSAGKRVEATLSRVRKLSEERNLPDPERLFDAMPPRYLLQTAPQDILRHLDILHGLNAPFRDPASTYFRLLAREEKADESWEVTVIAKDRPGLFSHIAGALALNNINVLSAHIYTWLDGTAVDIFRVTEPLDSIHPEDIWERVREDLRSAITGKIDLSERLAQKGTSSILRRPGRPGPPPKVIIDNESSDFFTLIEVFCSDHIGLLHDITRTLFTHGTNIRIAKIATKVDQIADIFYVRDMEGQKLLRKDQLEDVKEALLRVVSRNQRK